MPNPSKILYSSPFPGIVLGWFLALEAVVVTIDPHAVQYVACGLLWLYIEIQRIRDRKAKGVANASTVSPADLADLFDLVKSVAGPKAPLDPAVKPILTTPPEARPDGKAPKADRA